MSEVECIAVVQGCFVSNRLHFFSTATKIKIRFMWLFYISSFICKKSLINLLIVCYDPNFRLKPRPVTGTGSCLHRCKIKLFRLNNAFIHVMLNKNKYAIHLVQCSSMDPCKILAARSQKQKKDLKKRSFLNTAKIYKKLCCIIIS